MNGQASSGENRSTQSVWGNYVPYFQDTAQRAQELARLQSIGGPNDVYARSQLLSDKYSGMGDAALVGMLQNTVMGGGAPMTGLYGNATSGLSNLIEGGGSGGGAYMAGTDNIKNPGSGYRDRVSYQGNGPWNGEQGFNDLQTNYFDRLQYNEGPGYSDNQSFNEQGPYQDAERYQSHNNPYMDQMVANAQESVATNMQRNILPSIGDNSGGAGQYGSSRQGIAEGLAMSDANAQAANIATEMYGRMYENNEQRRAAAFEGAAQRALAGNEGYNTRSLENVNATQGRRLSAFEGAAGRALQAFEGAMGREYGGWGLGEGNRYSAWNDAQNRALQAYEGQAGRDFANAQSINDRSLQAWLQDTQGNTARDTANIGAAAQMTAAAQAAAASRYGSQIQGALGQQSNELQRMGLGQSQQELMGNLYNQLIAGSGNLYNLGMSPEQAAWGPIMNYKQTIGPTPILTDSWGKESSAGGGIT